MFSIIVPSYNRKDEIPYLLESLTLQKKYNFEVIIIDDHSKEAVEINKFYPFPIQIIRNEINKGASVSRNIGVDYAKNEWLLFLDDDDRFSPEKTQILSDVIEKNPQINFIYHPAECVMVNEGFTYFTHPYSNLENLTLENMLKANKIGGMPMLAVKKAFYLKLNGLSTDLHSLEDYDFVLKAVSDKDFRPFYVDLPLSQCAFHTKRASVSTNNHNTEKAIDVIQQKYVKTPQQYANFKFNSLYMLAYPYMMNLSRKAAKYYFELFKLSKNIKYLAVATITFISPKIAINMKRFM